MLRFCRACYATLSDDETVCHECGVRWPEAGSSNANLSKPPIHILTRPAKVEKQNISRESSLSERSEGRKATSLLNTKIVLASLFIILLLSGGGYLLFRQERQQPLSPTATTTLQSQVPTNYRLIVIFRDDDVQPYFGAASLKRLIEIFDGSNIPVTLGIIPNADGKSPINIDKDQLTYLQGILPSENMHETALHGLTHLNMTFEPSGLGWSEFAGIPLQRQREMIKQGLTILHSAFPTISITSFIPPFNSYDSDTLIALREQNLTVISTDDYTEAVLFGNPPPPRNLPPTPQSPDLPTSQPFVLNGIVHLPANYETYNWTTNSFIPLQKQEQRFELFYARPGSTFTLLLHHWLYTYIPGGHFEELQSFISYIKGHDGIKFMTMGQFTKLFTAGALKKTIAGWQLFTPDSDISTFSLETNPGLRSTLSASQASKVELAARVCHLEHVAQYV